MIEKSAVSALPTFALMLFQPEPNILYSLEATAHLAGLSRRSLLLYVRAGLVQPFLQEPHGAMAFPDEAIYTIRRLERVRARHRSELEWLRTFAEFEKETAYLRSELTFYRHP